MMLRLPSESPDRAGGIEIWFAANSQLELERCVSRAVRQNHAVGYVVHQAGAEQRRRNTKAQIRGIAEIRLLHRTIERIRAAADGEERKDHARFGRSHSCLRPHREDRTIGLQEAGNSVARAMTLCHFELRILPWTRSTRCRPGMAAAATGAVKSRSQVDAGFKVACDGMYFLESRPGVSEIPGVDSGHRATRACSSRPHA